MEMGKARYRTRDKGRRTSRDVKEVRTELGLCITDLPKSISIGILASLPLSCVLICRCVCKTWRDLIKDSEFVKLHFSQAEAHPLIRKLGPTFISRILYFVDQPPKYKPCYDSECSRYNYDRHNDCENHIKMKLATKLKIPLRNPELAIIGEGEANVNLHSKRKCAINMISEDHKLNLVNSCNGFLCLSEPIHNAPVMVCNPITGEYINIPVQKTFHESSREFIDCGLGFCPKTNQYKVVRTFEQQGREYNIEPVTGIARWNFRVAEIHTLGTNTWKKIGYAPCLPENGKSTYLNGTLNWLHKSYHDSPAPYYIASFDVGEEKFQPIPIPPKKYGQMNVRDKDRILIGELRGCLCVSDASDFGSGKIELWVMKTYGVESTWKIEVEIDITTPDRRSLHGLYEPLSYFKDGTLLLFHSWSDCVFCYYPKDKYLKLLNLCGRQSDYEAISYIPSFISLKDATVGDNVEVYDVKSRFGDLILKGESKPVSLVEESADWESDVNSVCSED